MCLKILFSDAERWGLLPSLLPLLLARMTSAPTDADFTFFALAELPLCPPSRDSEREYPVCVCVSAGSARDCHAGWKPRRILGCAWACLLWNVTPNQIEHS